MDSFSRKKFILDIPFFFLLMRNAVAFESRAKFCFSSCYDQKTGKLSRHYSLHKQRDLSFNWVKKYCNFWDERNSIIIMLVLHYKNHILWNKGNIQNSARYIVHYSIEKDNETPIITCGLNMGSHAPNEICVLPRAGLVMKRPLNHVWKGSLLRASVCKYRESRDSFKIFNFFLFCPNKPFSELLSKI